MTKTKTFLQRSFFESGVTRFNESEECDLRNELVTEFEYSEYSHVATRHGAI